MKSWFRQKARSQAGFTLIELIIASAIGLAVMTALTSVVFTTWKASVIASSRVEASAQIRNFQLVAYDDFVGSGPPTTSGCGGVPAGTCITLPVTRASNPDQPVTVTYKWDGVRFLDRCQDSQPCRHVSTNVKAFIVIPDGGALVVKIKISIPTDSTNSYTQSQTLRFLPRLN